MITASLIGGMIVLAATIGFVGQGNTRHVEIFWQERVEQTILFEEINGKPQISAIKGVSSENNPTLISRTSFALCFNCNKQRN